MKTRATITPATAEDALEMCECVPCDTSEEFRLLGYESELDALKQHMLASEQCWVFRKNGSILWMFGVSPLSPKSGRPVFALWGMDSTAARSEPFAVFRAAKKVISNLLALKGDLMTCFDMRHDKAAKMLSALGFRFAPVTAGSSLMFAFRGA